MSRASGGPEAGAREPAEIATAVIEAINSRDPARLSRLLDADAEVVTGRSTHTGAEAIVAWAGKQFDHLQRRYAIDELRTAGNAVLALGRVQHVWTETEEVADSSPVALELKLSNGQLSSLKVHDDPTKARAIFES